MFNTLPHHAVANGVNQLLDEVCYSGRKLMQQRVMAAPWHAAC